MMLLFSSYLEPGMRYILGYFFITVVFIFVVYNIIIMLLLSCKLLILIVRKQYYRVKRRKLGHEIKKIVGGLQVDLGKLWFVPDDMDAETEMLFQPDALAKA